MLQLGLCNVVRANREWMVWLLSYIEYFMLQPVQRNPAKHFMTMQVSSLVYKVIYVVCINRALCFSLCCTNANQFCILNLSMQSSSLLDSFPKLCNDL